MLISYMRIINLIEEEHEQIDRELDELEEVLDEMVEEEIINFSNLVHSLKKLKELWDKHEAKEEKIFSIFRKDKIVIPVKTILFEHGDLRKSLDHIMIALSSEKKVKSTILREGKAIIKNIRDHKIKEDEILLTISPEEITGVEIRKLEELADELL